MKQENWFFCNLVEEYVFHYIHKPPFLLQFHDCLYISNCKNIEFVPLNLIN